MIYPPADGSGFSVSNRGHDGSDRIFGNVGQLISQRAGDISCIQLDRHCEVPRSLYTCHHYTGKCPKFQESEHHRQESGNAKRDPLCENRRFPLSQKPTVSCLLSFRPSPPQNAVSVYWNADSFSRIAYSSPRRKRQGSVTPSLVLSPQSHSFAGTPYLRLRDFSNRFMAASSTLFRLSFFCSIRFFMDFLRTKETVDIGLGRQ